MIKKGDFIEIEFTGRIKGSDEIFDTTIKSDAEKAGLDIKNLKPFTLAVGHKMLPIGFDEDLEGKEVGKSYSVTVSPEKAFGKRNPQMVRMIPTKLFHEQRINPVRGMQLALDGQLVKVLSNSSGRTLVDFNNPLAGKEVVYDYKILKQVTDAKEKIDSLQEFLFRKKFDYDLEGNKVIFKVEKELEPFIKMISKKFEEVLSMTVETQIVESKKAQETEKSD
jgi:FKBP-type peptidyl-prolyl cis-trans isomerase 2